MILVAVVAFTILFYIVGWATILNNAFYSKDKDTFTLKFWIFLHFAVIGTGLIWLAVTNR